MSGCQERSDISVLGQPVATLAASSAHCEPHLHGGGHANGDNDAMTIDAELDHFRHEQSGAAARQNPIDRCNVRPINGTSTFFLRRQDAKSDSRQAEAERAKTISNSVGHEVEPSGDRAQCSRN